MFRTWKASFFYVCFDRFNRGRLIACGEVLSTTNGCFHWEFESTLEIFLPSKPNPYPSSESLSPGVDDPEKTNDRPKWRPIQRQNQRNRWGHDPSTHHWSQARCIGHWLLRISECGSQRPHATIIRRLKPLNARRHEGATNPVRS